MQGKRLLCLDAVGKVNPSLEQDVPTFNLLFSVKTLEGLSHCRFEKVNGEVTL